MDGFLIPMILLSIQKIWSVTEEQYLLSTSRSDAYQCCQLFDFLLKQSIRENKEKWQRALLVFLTKNFQNFGRVDKNLSNFLSDLKIQMFYSVETKRLLIWKCQRHYLIITRIITSKLDNFSKSDKNLSTFVSTLANF